MKALTSVTHPEFDDTILGSIDVCISFTRTTAWSFDPSYGSDADGNRGIPMTDIDEDSYTGIEVSWGDLEADGVEHNDIPFDELPTNMQPHIEAAVEQYMQQNEPEMPEEPEEDADDQDENE